MDRRLAAGKLHHLRITFGADVVVQNVFDFFERQAEPGPGFGKTQRTGHIAGAVHFDDAQAGVLLMVRAQAAIVRAAVLHFGRELHGNRARLVELRGIRIGLRVAINQPFEHAMIRAALAHVDLVVANQDVRVDHAPAFRANAARQFIEDVVGVLLGICLSKLSAGWKVCRSLGAGSSYGRVSSIVHLCQLLRAVKYAVCRLGHSTIQLAPTKCGVGFPTCTGLKRRFGKTSPVLRANGQQPFRSYPCAQPRERQWKSGANESRQGIASRPSKPDGYSGTRARHFGSDGSAAACRSTISRNMSMSTTGNLVTRER